MATTTKSIGAGKNYATVTLWHADAYGGNGGDDCYGQMYGDIDDDDIALSDATMNSVTLQAAPGEECLGVESNGARLYTSGGGNQILETQITALVLEDFEVDGNGQGIDSLGALHIDHNSATLDDVIVRRLLIHDLTNAAANDWLAGIWIDGNAGGTSILNCAIYDVSHGGNSTRDAFGIKIASTRPIEIRNNSICDIHHTNGGDAWGIVNLDDSDHVYENNVICDVTTSGAAECWDVSTSVNCTANKNASDDSTAPAAIATEPVDSSVEFESDASPWDLTLASGAESIDAGTDLGTTRGVNVSITSRDRDSEGDTWDLGAYEYVSSGRVITAAQALPSLTQSGTLAVDVAATGAQTLPSLTQTGALAVAIEGTAAQTLPSLTQSASLITETGIASAQTLSSLTQAGSLITEAVVTGSQTLPSLTQSASLSVDVLATGVQTLPSLMQAATMTTTTEVAAAQTLSALMQSASLSGEGVSLDGGQTLPALTQAAALSGEGAVVNGAQTLPSLTQAGTLAVDVTASGAQTLPSLSQTGNLAVGVTATGAQTLPALTQSGTWEVVVAITAAQALPSLTQTAALVVTTPAEVGPFIVIHQYVHLAGSKQQHVHRAGDTEKHVYLAGAETKHATTGGGSL